jgi:two-component system invasion response regulator UvrY
MKKKIRVYIIDKETLVHVGLKTIINSNWKDAKFLTQINTNGDLLEIPDIIILGTVSRNKYNGVKELKSLMAKFPLSAILIFSALDEWTHAIPYLKAGARGYLCKDATEPVIVSAIETVLAAKYLFCSGKLKEELLNGFFLDALNGKDKKASVPQKQTGYKRSSKKTQSKKIKDLSDGITY